MTAGNPAPRQQTAPIEDRLEAPDDAGDADDRWAVRPWSVVALVNSAFYPWPTDSPGGYFGLRLSRYLDPYIAIEVGAGYPASGMVLGLMRFPASPGFALTLGIGGAMGRYEQFDPAGDRSIHVYDSARWFVLEPGLELRSRGGWVVRLDLDLAALLNPDVFQCRAPADGAAVRPCDPSAQWDHPAEPYSTGYSGLGLGVGLAF